MPLSEQVRVEIFIPDSPDPGYIAQYVERLKDAVELALEKEEAILIAMYPVCHAE